MSNHIPDATKMVCPKCRAVDLRFIDTNTKQFNCGSISRNGTVVIQTAICTTKERDQLCAANAALVESVKHLQAWKDSWLKIESEWDAHSVAVMLGGKVGESTRVVIAREVPRLVERVKRLEAAGDAMASWLRNPRNLGDDPFMADKWEAAKGQP